MPPLASIAKTLWKSPSESYLARSTCLGCSTCAPGPAEGSPGEMCWQPKVSRRRPLNANPREPRLPPASGLVFSPPLEASEVGPGSHNSQPGDVLGCWLLGSQSQELPAGIFPEMLLFTLLHCPPPPFLVLRILPGPLVCPRSLCLDAVE